MTVDTFRAVVMLPCAKCKLQKVRGDTRFDLCAACFAAWDRAGRRACAACDKNPQNFRYDLCDACFGAWRAACAAVLKAGPPAPIVFADPTRSDEELSKESEDESEDEDVDEDDGSDVDVDDGSDADVDDDEGESSEDSTMDDGNECITCDPAAQAAPAAAPDMWKAVSDFGARAVEMKKESCCICLCPLLEDSPADQTPLVQLVACSHVFHRDCIANCVKNAALKCPLCGAATGVLTGNQPAGKMQISKARHSLPGHPGAGTIIVQYYFPSGVQTAEHPNPGHHYSGTSRETYFPDTPEGNKVVELLKEAFRRRMTFTVGTSVTTGQPNCVIWAGIHHKTDTSGGEENHGYPDPTYLQRVTHELAAAGVVDCATTSPVPAAT
eukprot:TRINITY_DN3163_c0_g2_i1.p1 TRINITY_DN3163_c0_g2~~TRINITY_DN3163_c0_g2_i1.p1  ORF type:complete len:383 (+),score=97.14 TRINITY_DN3163_c0_g2_i1:156-1304(+)